MSEPVLDLDDESAVLAADTGGALRSAAALGATLRAADAARTEGVFAQLEGLRPRSLVLVAPAGSARAGAALAAAALGPLLPFPVVLSAVVPSWVGALDIVVVAGDDPGDPALFAAGVQAPTRHAEVVLAVPLEGPLTELNTDRAMLAAPRVPTARPQYAGHVFAVATAVATVVEPRLGVDLAALADAADDEAGAGAPGVDLVRNRAKGLADALFGRSVLWVAADQALIALAGLASATLVSAGNIGAAADLPTALGAAERFAAPGASRDLFFDPDFDLEEPVGGPAVRTVVLATAEEVTDLERRTALLPSPQLEAPGGTGLAGLVQLWVRVDLASAYHRVLSAGS